MQSLPWLHKLIPGLEKLAAKYNMGNYVKMRGSDEKFFEPMPLYARVGMHLLFSGTLQKKLLQFDSVGELLKTVSIREGEIYNSPSSVKAIPSFIETYNLDLSDALHTEFSCYENFNDFFTRKLKPGARPIQDEEDPATVPSIADCRLMVYDTVGQATKFWVKGREFTIPNLLGCSKKEARAFEHGSLAIFRLAPQDYHRWHSPIEGTVDKIVDIAGQLYTVNPQAVCQEGFDVFTANKRSVMYMTHKASGLPVAVVAIGALLVGSIVWTKSQVGDTVKRGEELGYFAYGGSTLVVVFPRNFITYDTDLLTNSREPVETLVKVGYRIGKRASPSLPKKIRRASVQFFEDMATAFKTKERPAHSESNATLKKQEAVAEKEVAPAAASPMSGVVVQ